MDKKRLFWSVFVVVSLCLIAGLLAITLSYSVIDYMYNSISEYTNHSVDDRLRALVEEFKSAIAEIVFLIMLALAVLIITTIYVVEKLWFVF